METMSRITESTCGLVTPNTVPLATPVSLVVIVSNGCAGVINTFVCIQRWAFVSTLLFSN